MMNTYQNVSNELRSYFSSHKIFKILMPLDIIIMFAGLAIMFLTNILGVSVGSFFSALSFWLYILGLLLTYANLKEQFLYIGLLGHGALRFIELLIALFGRYHYLSWSSLFGIIVYGGLGYLVLKRTLAKSSGINING